MIEIFIQRPTSSGTELDRLPGEGQALCLHASFQPCGSGLQSVAVLGDGRNVFRHVTAAEVPALPEAIVGSSEPANSPSSTSTVSSPIPCRSLPRAAGGKFPSHILSPNRCQPPYSPTVKIVPGSLSPPNREPASVSCATASDGDAAGGGFSYRDGIGPGRVSWTSGLPIWRATTPSVPRLRQRQAEFSRSGAGISPIRPVEVWVLWPVSRWRRRAGRVGR